MSVAVACGDGGAALGAIVLAFLEHASYATAAICMLVITDHPWHPLSHIILLLTYRTFHQRGHSQLALILIITLPILFKLY